MATLEDRADADGELLSAALALLEAVPDLALWAFLRRLGANALQLIGFTDDAAMRANRPVRPEHGFDMGEGRRFVVHVRR